MKVWKEPKSPEEALKRLEGAVNRIAQGKVQDYKPEAKQLIRYLRGGLVSLQEFKRKFEEQVASTDVESNPVGE